MLFARNVVLSVLLAGTAAAQPMPPKLREVLTRDLRLNEQAIQLAEGGNAVAQQVETGDPEDVFMVGVVRIQTTPSDFAAKFRSITDFEASRSVSAMGVFSRPPTVRDLAALKLSKEEVDDIKDCEPGDCEFKMGDTAMQRFRTRVNWRAADYTQQANGLIRELWTDLLKAYQASGNSALPAYHDTDRIFRVQDGLSAQLKKSPFLYQISPELLDYLAKYPQARLPDSEDFFYWQVAEFGLKPVHRVTHVVMQRKQAQAGEGVVIGSKMLFASHYFRSALELRYLIPVQNGSNAPMLYLVVLQRSYVDGLTGFKGSLLRGTVMSRTRQALEGYMKLCKARGEARARSGGNSVR